MHVVLWDEEEISFPEFDDIYASDMVHNMVTVLTMIVCPLRIVMMMRCLVMKRNGTLKRVTQLARREEQR